MCNFHLHVHKTNEEWVLYYMGAQGTWKQWLQDSTRIGAGERENGPGKVSFDWQVFIKAYLVWGTVASKLVTLN